MGKERYKAKNKVHEVKNLSSVIRQICHLLSNPSPIIVICQLYYVIISPVKCHLSSAICHLSSAICYLSSVICFLSTTIGLYTVEYRLYSVEYRLCTVEYRLYTVEYRLIHGGIPSNTRWNTVYTRWNTVEYTVEYRLYTVELYSTNLEGITDRVPNGWFPGQLGGNHYNSSLRYYFLNKWILEVKVYMQYTCTLLGSGELCGSTKGAPFCKKKLKMYPLPM